MSNSSFGYHGEQVNQRYNDGQSNVSHPVSTQQEIYKRYSSQNMQFSLRTTFNYEVESQDAGLYQNQGSRLVVLMENDEQHELDIEK